MVHIGRLRADDVDGLFEGSDDVEGAVDGVDESPDEGATDGAEEGLDEGINDGFDDVDGSVEDIVGHPTPKMVDALLPKLPLPSRMSSL